jgi:hypothetical protein
VPLNICPSLFYIIPDAAAASCDEHDTFQPDRFRILQAESLTHVKEIAANTGTNRPLQIRLLCCYRMKNLPENYCEYRRVDRPKKRVCDEHTGIKNCFVHFHIKIKKTNNNEYLLAFIEGADLYTNIEILVDEMFKSVEWLEIAAKRVLLSIFTFGEPAFRTRNVSYLDKCINDYKNILLHAHQISDNAEYNCDLMHISKDYENRVTVSMRNNNLHFAAS